MIPEININEYHYDLNVDKIAKYPLQERDLSKLLIYKEESVAETTFKNIVNQLPESSVMVFNDTKVVPARLHFQRPTGAHIEIFCLEPVLPTEYNLCFAQKEVCRFRCIVGNIKRWKGDILTLYNPNNSEDISKMALNAELIEREGETSIIEFRWKLEYEFSRVLEICGSIPIPPYLNRDTEDIDLERYQTLYARFRGSVAAPTAGLHFTDSVLSEIRAKDINIQTVCLHVGAGTFLPVKSEYISAHSMHREPFIVRLDFLETLLNKKGHTIAVGTTSVRTLESLYYLGVNCIETGKPQDVGQWMPYEKEYTYDLNEALTALIIFMKTNNLVEIQAGTRIIIVPGFRFRVVDVLVTNFHQPGSTLLLLISAFVGGNWKKIYDYALTHDFRFLSYGDSSILFRHS